MGTNNRQRRADKARRRARDHRQHREQQQSHEARGVAAHLALDQLVRHRARGGRSEIVSAQFRAHPVADQQRAIDDTVALVIESVVEHGWSPADLHQFARRTVPDAAVAYLVGAVAATTSRHPAARVHPHWQAQLDEYGAAPVTAGRWAERYELNWPDAADTLVALLVKIVSLPVLEPVLPRPGSTPGAAATGAGIDAKVLQRVRALLAKAESTEFDAEAEALTAKAQQLMTEHAITHTLAEAAAHTDPGTTVRRLWLDNPYLVAKSLLVTAVSGANHCRSVLSESLGCVTVVGHHRDLDVVELLTTSLLVQATRAMTSAGSQTNRYGRSTTRSYRQSFLVAYAGRIRERLHESSAGTEAAADVQAGGALLPVLASRDRAAEDKLGELFPGLVERSVNVSNSSGWGAGRTAADLASLDVHGKLDSAAG